MGELTDFVTENTRGQSSKRILEDIMIIFIIIITICKVHSAQSSKSSSRKHSVSPIINFY